MAISTEELLLQIGFEEDWGGLSHARPDYTYDFGSFVLTASEGINRHYVPVFFLDGIYRTERTIAQISYQLPLELESIDHCLALLAHALRGYSPGSPVEWLTRGRAMEELLPWVQDRKRFDARLKCSVPREWFRLAAREMRELAADCADEDQAEFSFDGSVLRIGLGGKTIATAAAGSGWDRTYAIPLSSLKALPKRLMSDPVWLDIWEERLRIGSLALPLSPQDSLI